VDLTVDLVLEPKSTGKMYREETEMPIRKRKEPYIEDTSDGESKRFYTLPRETYIIVYGEKISIPEDCIGIVQPRSTLMRMGSTVDTAVWDSGYEGRGEGRLVVDNKIRLEEGVRIAQIIFAEADSFGSYDGQYQGEKLE